MHRCDYAIDSLSPIGYPCFQHCSNVRSYFISELEYILLDLRLYFLRYYQPSQTPSSRIAGEADVDPRRTCFNLHPSGKTLPRDGHAEISEINHSLKMEESSVQYRTPIRTSQGNERDSRTRHSDVGPRDILELQEMQTREDNELENLTPSASSGDEYHIITRRTTSSALATEAAARRRREARTGIWGKFTRLWTHNVSLTVPLKSNRDYLGVCTIFYSELTDADGLKSFGADVPCVYPDFDGSCPARSIDCAAVSSAEGRSLD